MTTKRTARKARKQADSPRPSRAAKTVELKGDTSPTRDEVAKKAYELWIAYGCPEGQDLEHWHEAEVKLTLAL